MQTPAPNDGYRTYSPVTVTNVDTIGSVFLGLIALALLAALIRAQARIEVLSRRVTGEE
jgi:hypothetical protein